MSYTPAPYSLVSGYAFPAQSSSSSPFRASSVKPPKPANVFSNDGSFLERFQRAKKEDQDKRKRKETINRNKSFDNRFKTRGKRPPPVSTEHPDYSSSPEPPSKKLRQDSEARGSSTPCDTRDVSPDN